jgi:hypothetical protein
MNQRNDTSRAMTQKQREAIMRLLPSTVGKMATALGLPTRSVWKRLKTLEEQKAAQVVAQGSGKVQIWGYWSGVPYVHQRAKPLPIPPSPYKTCWVGGRYPAGNSEQARERQ